MIAPVREPNPALIAIGAIRKPFGVRGETSVEPWTDSPDRFAGLRDVVLVSPDETRSRQSRIESFRAHAGRALLKFEGIDSPEEIALFRGWTVEIPESEARPLEENEYFLHDLVGLELVDATGNTRGTVTAAYEGGGGVLLEVRQGQRTFDVPFAADICRTVDLAAKRILVELPEGIDEI